MITSEELKIFTDPLTVAPQFNGLGSSLKAHGSEVVFLVFFLDSGTTGAYHVSE